MSAGLSARSALDDRDDTEPLLVTKNLARTFGQTRALADCSFEVHSGEILALVGENGSGKSTLIKILSGVLQADTGRIVWSGVDARFAEPIAAARAGIATVFQETLVAHDLSVVDNVVLARERIVSQRRPRKAERLAARTALDELGLHQISLDAPVWTLTLAQRQLVTIARAFVRPWRLLILDEATSALDIDDRDRLFGLLSTARKDGKAVLFVSHRMDEIARIADRVTVLRGGHTIASLATADAPAQRLLALMSSSDGQAAAAGGTTRVARPTSLAAGPPIITIEGLRLTERSDRIDLIIEAGEIVGIAGLEGHGQVRLIDAIAGLEPARGGTVTAEAHAGAPQRQIANPRDAARAGIAYVPRDRKRDGLFGSLSIFDNLMLPSLSSFAVFGVLNQGPLSAAARALAERLQVRGANITATIDSLSGGNQQKVLLGRWIALSPRVLILNDPMRGVDQGTKLELYDVLRQLAARGTALLLLSTELTELCLLCDRVAVMREHSLTVVVPRAQLKERVLIEAMFEQRGVTAVPGE